jgi:hypothetical protein
MPAGTSAPAINIGLAGEKIFVSLSVWSDPRKKAKARATLNGYQLSKM